MVSSFYLKGVTKLTEISKRDIQGKILNNDVEQLWFIKYNQATGWGVHYSRLSYLNYNV